MRQRFAGKKRSSSVLLLVNVKPHFRAILSCRRARIKLTARGTGMSPKSTVIVRGAGDVGSTVAHVLRSAGYRVLVHDGPRPPHSRRGMSFVDAFYEGVSLLEGVMAKR